MAFQQDKFRVTTQMGNKNNTGSIVKERNKRNITMNPLPP